MSDKLLYLLVCEGPSDIPVITKVTEEICLRNGKNVEIRHISPQQDNTGSWERHGWTGVMRWCGLYGTKSDVDLEGVPEAIKNAVKRRNWKALVKAANADGLIVQMDTDIVSELRVLPQKFDLNKDDRRTYCQGSINNKLGLTSNNEELILLLPSYSTETWILATLDETNEVFNDITKPIKFEEITNCEQLLVNAGYRKERKNGKNKLKKSYDLYIPYADAVKSKLNIVRARCSELNLYCTNFETE